MSQVCQTQLKDNLDVNVIGSKLTTKPCLRDLLPLVATQTIAKTLMPEGWQLTPKGKRWEKGWHVQSLFCCARDSSLCQLRNCLSLVHFHFNPLIMVKQTFSGSQAGPLCHVPCSGRWGADKPQLMPPCHFFTSPSPSLWFVSVDRIRLLALVTVLAMG